MTSRIEQIRAQAALAAQSGPDMNEATKGGGGGRLLPAGYAFGRLVEYVEFGMQPQEFNGQAKQPALEVQVGFALWGEGYQEEDGSPYVIRPYSFAISRNEKARAFKLFRALNWKGTATHFAQLIGEAFLVKIVHVPKSKADKTLVSRVDLEGFLPPLDPVTKAPYPIPEAADELYRLFLWEHPTIEGWDSLFIEGTRDDGTSKNFVQERVLGAVDYEGSPLQQLLGGAAGLTLPAPVVPDADPTAGEASAPTKTSRTKASTEASTKAGSKAPVVPALPVVPVLPALPQ